MEVVLAERGGSTKQVGFGGEKKGSILAAGEFNSNLPGGLLPLRSFRIEAKIKVQGVSFVFYFPPPGQPPQMVS